MKLKEFKERLLRDAKFRKEYQKVDLAFEIGQMLIEARIIKGITQERLAKMIGTEQPSIARLESGSSLPSLSFLERIAKALKTYLLPPKFAFMELDKTKISLIAENSKNVGARESSKEELEYVQKQGKSNIDYQYFNQYT